MLLGAVSYPLPAIAVRPPKERNSRCIPWPPAFDDLWGRAAFVLIIDPCRQNSPVITPSPSMAKRSAAGVFGNPGMVRISPASATTNPAPAHG